MPVPNVIGDLSTTASSNSPAGSEGPQEGDNYLRALSAFIAQLRDKLNGTSDTGTVKNATFSGTMAGAASWSGLQTFAAGIAASNFAGTTYTPTVTGVANVASVTGYESFYQRVGSVCHVAGSMDVDPTVASNTRTRVRISLPIASALTTAHQVSGTGSDSTSASASGNSAATVYADDTNDAAELSFHAGSAASSLWFFNFTYRVI